MVSLIRERTTDIVNATSHLFYYMEGENDYGAQDFVNTMMEICSELKNQTNDYETFPMMKKIVDMLNNINLILKNLTILYLVIWVSYNSTLNSGILIYSGCGNYL